MHLPSHAGLARAAPATIAGMRNNNECDSRRRSPLCQPGNVPRTGPASAPKPSPMADRSPVPEPGPTAGGAQAGSGGGGSPSMGLHTRKPSPMAPLEGNADDTRRGNRSTLLLGEPLEVPQCVPAFTPKPAPMVERSPVPKPVPASSKE